MSSDLPGPIDTAQNSAAAVAHAKTLPTITN